MFKFIQPDSESLVAIGLKTQFEAGGVMKHLNRTWTQLQNTWYSNRVEDKHWKTTVFTKDNMDLFNIISWGNNRFSIREQM